MSTIARAEANRAQRLASDPAASAFVAASAGSGKTKLLTDRLLRLMLSGADPARIQCLTFTKAAAAEMAVRLQRRLGGWVTLDNQKLDQELAALDVATTEANRTRARALFATVLDLPGGMRIGTIHAFCQSLLRRFPIEAALSPHFRLMDDLDAEVALSQARETMLAGAFADERRAALQSLAGLVPSLDSLGKLLETLRKKPDHLETALREGPDALERRLRHLLGARDPDECAASLASDCDAPALLSAARALSAGTGSMAPALGQGLSEWLALDPATRADSAAEWRALFFTKAGEPRTRDGLVRGKFLVDNPHILTALTTEQSRIQALDDAARAHQVAALSTALASLAAPVAQAYASAKQRTGMLDFADLIRASTRLLIDPGAAWVLYKLDGGIDHLLLDEVQDTAPEQWEIAGKLSDEFFAGQGAQETQAAPRTVFAVGDRKQSIYGFQGADPQGFQTWRDIWKRRAEAAHHTWRDVPLDVSFRSTEPVLKLVDAVFAAAPASDGLADPGTLRHLADRAGHAGTVELWPLAPDPPRPEATPWTVPDRNQQGGSARQRLADTLATWIAQQTRGTTLLESKGRPLAPGDVLILVRRRDAFARALVGALKANGVPVAGLDRLVLTEQPAVADLLALCDTLLLPEDDLSLACVLTSPLGGLTDPSLMELAATRTGSLWSALRDRHEERPEWAAAHEFLRTLLSRVDYATPHALLTEALGRLGARARLLARLGPEAAEPIDELLNAALTHARTHPPALQGFLHWLRQSGAEVKREAEGAGNMVRLMTVHGAKGLQAPLVILPDTTGLPPDDGTICWSDTLPVWSPRKELRCRVADALRQAKRAAEMEEQNRLLYVALTRAEDRLVICGWSPRRAPPDTCWYRLVQQGFAPLAPTARAFDIGPDPWEGEILTYATPQSIAPDTPRTQATAHAPTPPPAWAGTAPLWHPNPVPLEPALPSPLAPSRPEGIQHGPIPAADSPLLQRDATGQRFRRGHLAHALLQHLPDLPPEAREQAAQTFLSRPGTGLDTPEATALAREVLAILAHPDLAPLFAPGSRAEVPLTGVVAGNIIGGLVDRLAILPDRILVADYKTNRAAPTTPEAAPVAYLRQMSAYRAVLRGIFPGRAIACALVWTAGPRVMPLPDSLLDLHAPAASHLAAAGAGQGGTA
jgi:ATP-dependent helicase/nuclease subunit A